MTLDEIKNIRLTEIFRERELQDLEGMSLREIEIFFAKRLFTGYGWVSDITDGE